MRETKKKMIKILKWISLLAVSPLLRFLLKNPLDVITFTNLVDHHKAISSSSPSPSLMETVNKVYCEKGMRGFYVGYSVSFWEKVMSGVILATPLPFLGLSSHSKHIFNLLLKQILHFSLCVVRVRMVTDPLFSNLSLFSSLSKIINQKGFSSLFKGLNHYLFLLPIVALQYWLNSSNQNKPN